MMGCGKSSTGRLLAGTLDVPFIDLDQRLERVFGASVETLFAAGEADFREREAVALRTLALEPAFALRPCVVATGGGCVLRLANRDLMASLGEIVFLEVAPQELARRMTATQLRARPLLAQLGPDAVVGRLAQILAEREPCYRDRARVVHGGNSPPQTVQAILLALDAPVETGDSPVAHPDSTHRVS